MDIKFKRLNSEKIVAVNTKNGNTCEIIKITCINEPMETEFAKWRIDFNGHTVDTMIKGLKRTKQIARQILK